jgi:hypothetical protein
VRFAYADPPYPGQSAKHYADHPDYAGEVDHRELLDRLVGYYGWWLHTSSVALRDVLRWCPPGVRVMAWVKPFAAYKRNIKVAYAWEPVIVWGGRPATPNRIEGLPMRDFIAEPMTVKRGLVGAKPERLCWWLFEVLGCELDDQLDDLFPGTGAVTRAWESWRHYLLRDESNLRMEIA